MKNYISILVLFIGCVACNQNVAEKPEKLLTEDQMVDIIYDLALLEGMRSADPESIKSRGIDPTTYVFRKYKIDSLQLAQNERYYAADVDAYAKVYERVGKRIERNRLKADSLAKVATVINTTPEPLANDSAVIPKPKVLKRRPIERPDR